MSMVVVSASIALDDVLPDLLKHDRRKVWGDHFVHVAVSDHQAVAVGPRQVVDEEALVVWDGGPLYRAEMEEDGGFRPRHEFLEELTENHGRATIADLIKENAKAAIR